MTREELLARHLDRATEDRTSGSPVTVAIPDPGSLATIASWNQMVTGVVQTLNTLDRPMQTIRKAINQQATVTALQGGAVDDVLARIRGRLAQRPGEPGDETFYESFVTDLMIAPESTTGWDRNAQCLTLAVAQTGSLLGAPSEGAITIDVSPVGPPSSRSRRNLGHRSGYFPPPVPPDSREWDDRQHTDDDPRTLLTSNPVQTVEVEQVVLNERRAHDASDMVVSLIGTASTVVLWELEPSVPRHRLLLGVPVRREPLRVVLSLSFDRLHVLDRAMITQQAVRGSFARIDALTLLAGDGTTHRLADGPWRQASVSVPLPPIPLTGLQWSLTQDRADFAGVDLVHVQTDYGQHLVYESTAERLAANRLASVLH